MSRRSGVSVSTVSRALNGYSDVSAATRQRVQELARELGYSPSEAARTLVRRRSTMVGVVWDPGFRQPAPHPFLHEVLDGVRYGLGTRGYDTLLLAPVLDEAAQDPEAYVRRARQLSLAGVVVMGVDPAQPCVSGLIDSSVPVVLVDIDQQGSRTVRLTSDNVGGAALAARHLHATGRRRLACITGPLDLPTSGDRLRGFREELAALGVALPGELVEAGDFFYDGGAAAMRRLLELPERPDGVFVCGDLMALGAMTAVAEAGLRVPEDVAIVGFDDVPAAAYARPALTTVRQDVPGFGAAAAEQILALTASGTDAEPAGPVVLETSLVVRASCGAAR
nr:LacI family DNA-binding transcriptional regulator [Motilibacter deserti]